MPLTPRCFWLNCDRLHLSAWAAALALALCAQACTSASTSGNGTQYSHAGAAGTTSSHTGSSSGGSATSQGGAGGNHAPGGSGGSATSQGGTLSNGGVPTTAGDAGNAGGAGGESPLPPTLDASAPIPGCGALAPGVDAVDAGACTADAECHPSEGAQHVAECSIVSYGTNPPSSGNHYPIWAAFGVYEFALPSGYWMHNMEHGAVVILYNCPQGCGQELTALTDWFNNLPVDDTCLGLGATQPRALLVPYPDLDVRFAATAWQHTLRADCFDEVAFTAFYQSNVGHGLEVVCSSGAEFRQPNGMPVATLPTDCGQ